MRELDARAFRIGRVFERLPSGASGQIAVAGAYAWAVTVAPALWEGGAAIAQAAAGAAFAALLVGSSWVRRPAGKMGGVGGRRSGCTRGVALGLRARQRAGLAVGARRDSTAPHRRAAGSGWDARLGALRPRLRGPRARRPTREPQRVVDGAPLEARRGLAGGDAAYLAVGTGFALALQFVGWRVASPERGLLVRLVALAAGLAFVGASTEIALARHVPRARRRWRVRWRSARVALAALATLALAGLLLAARD